MKPFIPKLHGVFNVYFINLTYRLSSAIRVRPTYLYIFDKKPFFDVLRPEILVVKEGTSWEGHFATNSRVHNNTDQVTARAK